MISDRAITEWTYTAVVPWMQGRASASRPKETAREKKKPAKEEKKPAEEEKKGKEDAPRKRRTAAEVLKEVQEGEPIGSVERALYGLPPDPDDNESDYEDGYVGKYKINDAGDGLSGHGGGYDCAYMRALRGGRGAGHGGGYRRRHGMGP